jgi:hypothetical protein
MGNVIDRIKGATDTELKRENIFIYLLILVFVILYLYYRTASNTPILPSGRNTTMDVQQYALATLYAGMKGSKAAIVTSDAYRTITYKSLVNFYGLACRYTGYIGPIEDGYFSVDTSIQMAVDAGCRVFVLDIDYIDKQCSSSTYIPRIVVRDSKGRMMIQYNNNYQINNPIGEIRQVCEAIQNKAFSSIVKMQLILSSLFYIFYVLLQEHKIHYLFYLLFIGCKSTCAFSRSTSRQ